MYIIDQGHARFREGERMKLVDLKPLSDLYINLTNQNLETVELFQRANDLLQCAKQAGLFPKEVDALEKAMSTRREAK